MTRALASFQMAMERRKQQLPDDLRRQVEDGFITQEEAENIAKGLNPNGTPKRGKEDEAR